MERRIVRIGLALAAVAAIAGCTTQVDRSAASSLVAPPDARSASGANSVDETTSGNSDELPLDRLVASLPGEVFSATPVFGEESVTHVAIRMSRDDTSRLLNAIGESPELEGFQTESGENIREVATELVDPGKSDPVLAEEIEELGPSSWQLAGFQMMQFTLVVEGGLFGVSTSVIDSSGRRFGFMPILPSVAFPDDPADPNLDYTLDLPEPVKSHVIDAYESLHDDEFIVVVSIEGG